MYFFLKYAEGSYIIAQNYLQRKNFVGKSNKQGLGNLQSLYHYFSSRKIKLEEDERNFIIKVLLL